MKQIILLPNTKKLKERISQFGNIWNEIKRKNHKVLIESLHGEDLRWVEYEDVKE